MNNIAMMAAMAAVTSVPMARAEVVCTRPDLCPQAGNSAPTAQAGGWKLVWADEFDGTELDATKWSCEVGVVRNNEPQAYTDAKKNVRVENGCLVLEAHREDVANPKYVAGSTDFRKREKSRFSSGSVETLGKYSFTNAKVEVRARLSPVKGLFPAIWTMGTNITTVGWPMCGETDVFEATGNDPTPSSTMHWFAPDGRKLPNGKAYKSLGHRVVGANATDGFHVYSAEWTDTSVVFSFDGVPHFEYSLDMATVDGVNPYRLEQFLKLNLALAPWAGTEIDEAAFPGRFEIDWVRVYEKVPPPATASDWMVGKVGAFAHYLPSQSTFKYADDFDVPGLVAQLKAMKADYFVLTLGQNSGYYCAPNATYEKTAGYEPNARCAKRDVPAGIIAALKGTGIRFGLYLPSQPPNRDVKAAVAFGLAAEGVNGGDDRFITRECAEKWAAVIREWAERYGDGVSLWWFDGSYDWCGFDNGVAAKYKAACRAGNPKALVAFNGGVRKLARETESDYWAGEENEPLSVVPHAGRWYRPGLQWQVLTPMGFTWFWPDCRFRDSQLKDWLSQCTSRGGACTLEMKIDIKTGRLDRGQSEQFARMRAE